MDEIIINNLLCFINSGKDDFTRETLKDVAYCFFSHEEIKSAKSTVCNLLKKDISWRRDPDKKRKDLNDVIDFHEELTTGRNNWKFLSNSYKGMPPLGIQMLAPVLINLTTEVSKINECLPKFLDIRSEVLNTADTVRKMNIELIDVKDKFNKAVAGMEEATSNIADEDLNVLGELRSFRKSLGAVGNPDLEIIRGLFEEENNNSAMHGKESGDVLAGSDHAENDAASVSSSDGASPEGSDAAVPDSVSVLAADAIPLQSEKENLYSSALKRMKQASSNSQRGATAPLLHSGRIANSTQVGSSAHSASNGRTPRHGIDGPTTGQRGNNRGRLMGARKDCVSSLRAVRRTVDVFIGRIHKEADENVIKDYIKETFNIVCYKVEKLQIKTDLYNAFKVTMSFSERDALFNSDMWPEDVVINKFYNRSKKPVDNIVS